MAGNTRGPAPTYTEEDYQRVLDEVSTGIPFGTVCKRDGMPSVTAMHVWKEASAENAEKYARAKKAFCAALAAEMLVLADTPLIGEAETLELLGVMKRPGDDGPAVVLPEAELVVTEVKRGDNVARSTLMVKTRERYLRAMDPGVWGDKVAVDNKHSGAVGFSININNQPKPKGGA